MNSFYSVIDEPINPDLQIESIEHVSKSKFDLKILQTNLSWQIMLPQLC